MNAAEWQKVKEIMSAALELPTESRAAFLANETDETVRREVEQLIAAHEKATDFIANPLLVENGYARETGDAPLPEKIEDYFIISKIGEGGMGTVFLAEQRGEGFSKKVAIKLVKRGMDTNAVLKRFVMERQILSSLEHPNIARMLDGGSTADGLPFFVMEYVEGENIRDYCGKRNLSQNERLRLFLKTADAISYAHQNLIVHRDIKPSNIIVTENGDPKLLDFGVAKLFSADWHESTTGATLSNLRMMTPEYASPEQFLGQTTTTATDVYSVGVVLYELMTGMRPFGFNAGSTQDKLTLEPMRPSMAAETVIRKTTGRASHRTDDGAARTEHANSFRPNANALKGDLDNIILKAIRREPGERYRSIEEFSDDVRRYLNGLPVRATKDSRGYRLRKFVGRNRAVSALVGLAIILMAFSVWFGVRSVNERKRAEVRFNQVRKLANSVLFDYQDGIRNLPGSTAVRERMVKDAAAYLDGLAAEKNAEPELQIELARAYDRLGDVKGSFFTASLGNSVAAKEFYLKALAIKTKLRETDPAFDEEMAVTYDKLADLEFGNGNQNAAVELYRNGIEIRERQRSALPNDAEVRYRLAKGYRNVAVRGRSRENTEESLALCRKAIAMIDELLAQAPERVDFEESRADFVEGIPIILETNVDRRAEAIPLYRETIELRQKLAARYPHNMLVQQKLGMTMSYLGDTFYELSNLPAAIAEYRNALEILDPLAVRDPLNEQLKQDISAVRGSLAFVLAETGDTRESLEAFKGVVENFEKKFANDPMDSTTHFRLAMAKEGFAKSYRNVAKSSGSSAAEKKAANQKALALFGESLLIYRQYQGTNEAFPSANVDVNVAIREVEKAIEDCRKDL